MFWIILFFSLKYYKPFTANYLSEIGVEMTDYNDG